ncbi:phage baseplate assembly protein V [Streptomyces sp. NPDC002867]|uniref:phage baseplate assembly protein V n=1 Tax=unclassified Streptomyces TaxID=2593676 RepID=UPI00159FC435|nr:phage baseplate assembly protein V [Streptomyces sp. PKU-EA00015]NWF25885.1 baseplate assembly protein [Streptomyces sp. PKU-EA00015]
MAAGGNNRFLGKFRGRVVSNDDPLKIGRVTVNVPDVLGGETSTWALPCLPFTGRGSGQYVVPAEGAGVWVEFEQGDPSYPIWTGCWYGERGELPPDALTGGPAHQNVVIQTSDKHKFVMGDVPGGNGIRLQAATGAYIQVDEKGVTIANGQGASVVLSGAEVNINDGRLIVPGKQ